LALLDEHGDQVERIGPDVFLVPSSGVSEGRAYRVNYGLDHEARSCKDFELHGHETPCKHLLMLGVLAAKRRRRRRRTFRCEGCGERFPARERVEVGDGNLTFFESDALCRGCARAHGVL
jgi:hypothetical protein